MAEKKRPYDFEAEVAIVGGGHAGCMLAALLARNGISSLCIDQDDPSQTLQESFDGRTTAISFGSRHVIDAAGAWDALQNDACAIRDIHIMESGSPTLLRFLADDTGKDAFGWIVENSKLRQSLYAALRSLKLATHIAPARVSGFDRDEDGITVNLQDGRSARATLVVGADGRNSFTRDWMGIDTRGWSYNQRAVICTVRHEHGHNHVAVEDFRSEGPFAILPMQNDTDGNHRSAVVWTEHGKDKDSALHWPEDVFTAALNERFPDTYGRIEMAGKRFSYPLGLKHAQTYIADRMALVADAAHGIHPIAGQGLNLGLRDIAALVDILIDAKSQNKDLGGAALLHAYEKARRTDNMLMAGATDTLNKLFSNDLSSVRILRKIGLRAVQRFAPARHFFMKQAMGASGLLPELVRSGKFSSGR